MEGSEVAPYRVFRHDHPRLWSFLTSLPLALLALQASWAWSASIFVVWVVSQYLSWRPGSARYEAEARALGRPGPAGGDEP